MDLLLFGVAVLIIIFIYWIKSIIVNKIVIKKCLYENNVCLLKLKDHYLKELKLRKNYLLYKPYICKKDYPFKSESWIIKNIEIEKINSKQKIKE